MSVAVRACAGIVALILATKLLEIMLLLKWTLRRGSRFLASADSELFKPQHANQLLEALLKAEYPFYPDRSLFIRALGWVLDREAAIRFATYVFRFPTLMITASLLTGFSRDWVVERVLATLIFLGMWVWIAQVSSMRFLLGSVHTLVEVPIIGLGRKAGKLVATSDTPFRFFVMLYAGGYFTLVLGYSAIYSIYAVAPAPWAWMSGLDTTVHPFIETTYFSAVTFLTVGYGDITVHGTLGRLIVISQISAGFIMLILLLAAFAATTTPPDASGGRSAGMR